MKKPSPKWQESFFGFFFAGWGGWGEWAGAGHLKFFHFISSVFIIIQTIYTDVVLVKKKKVKPSK